MIISASFITTFTIIIITIILLIFIGVEYQLGHRPVFFSSCRYYSVRVTNFNKDKEIKDKLSRTSRTSCMLS